MHFIKAASVFFRSFYKDVLQINGCRWYNLLENILKTNSRFNIQNK